MEETNFDFQQLKIKYDPKRKKTKVWTENTNVPWLTEKRTQIIGRR